MIEHSDSFKDRDEPKSSAGILDAIADAQKEFSAYNDFCRRVDTIIGAASDIAGVRSRFVSDQEFDLFWASIEVIKPAVYSRPPSPVVAPRFPDRNKTAAVASELLERCITSTFERGDFDQTMLCARDDLVLASRGAIRVRYEDDEGEGKRVCDEHLDREDFVHEPSRKWSEVGWVAFAAYMSEREMQDRFPRADLTGATFSRRRDGSKTESTGTHDKCRVWEVWHRADNRVYWVSEGVEEILDDSAPFIDFEGFFPCPRPAYGVTRRRSLVPVPDYARFERHLEQINELTSRIYNLLEWVRVKGLIPAGGDVGTAVETALSQSSDDVLLIPIPAAGLMGGAGSQFVQFLPLEVFSAAIKGLIEARGQLIQDFYQLSGISDIMRGATEASETLGAQQLKSQFGSVRIRDKVAELQRLARDVARLTAEVIAEKFDEKSLLDMAQMQIPKASEIKARLKDLEGQAKKELQQLEDEMEGAVEKMRASGQQPDQKQLEEMQKTFQERQKAILSKYQPMIKQTSETVSIESVMELLRDQKTRAFTIEIATDSTVMADEMAEKASRAEFLKAFTGASGAVQPLLMAGEAGAKLAGGLLKFSLAPFRAGREMDSLVDDFVDGVAGMPKPGANDAEQKMQAAMAEANNKLAEAELQKAQASIAKVQVDAQKAQQDITLRAAEAQAKAQADQAKLTLELEKTQATIAETQARIEKIFAEIEKLGVDAGNQTRTQDREDIKTMADMHSQRVQHEMTVQDRQRSALESDRNYAMGERQQAFAERPEPGEAEDMD